MIIELSKSSGIGQRTIQKTLSEYKKEGTISSPNKKKIRPSILDKMDDFDKNAIMRKIHDFWFNREMPTVAKMLVAINEDKTLPNLKRSSFLKVLKDLQIIFVRKSCYSALIECQYVQCWRRIYLDQIRQYRAQNSPIYYLGEAWVNVGETHKKTLVDNMVNSPHDAFLRGLTTEQKEPSDEGKRLIVLHIGSTDGFVPGGLLYIETKTNTSNFHKEINSDTFSEWIVKILPLLRENAVIVMDNAPYQSVKKYKIPVISWEKENIINWLESKGEIVIQPTIKPLLMDKVETLKPQYDKYEIDEYVKDNNKTILRLPPYHYELNPIMLAWSSVKSYVQAHNNTFQLKDVQELLKRGVEHVTPEMWTNFVGQVIKKEKKFWDIDDTIDEVIEKDRKEVARPILTLGTDSTTDSDSNSN